MKRSLDDKSFCGYVQIEDKTIPFTFESNIVKLIMKDKFMPFGDNTTLPKYLYGVTEDNRDIVIMTSEKAQGSFHVAGFGTPMYVVSRQNLQEMYLSYFEKLSFIGKSANKVFDPVIIFDKEAEDKLLFREPYNGECMLKIKPESDYTRKIQLKILGQNVNFVVSVNYLLKDGDSTDNSLGEVNTKISIEFENKQPLEQLVEVYKIIMKLFDFMTVQKNNDFKRIEMCQKSPNSVYYDKIAYCFIKTHEEDIPNKDSRQVIGFVDIQNNLQNFINIFSDEDFSLGYLPEKNEDVGSIDYNIVKNVCTSLEFEYSKSKVKKEKNKKIKPLIDKVRAEVDDFKNNNDWFSDKLYDYINGNIGNWQLPAVEQFLSLYDENKNQLKKICLGNFIRKEIKVDYDSINAFVKLRNKITHGEKPIITQDDANFCYIMMALNYCALLRRAGLQDNDITNIINKIF